MANSNNTGENILIMENITKSFSGNEVLHSVPFSLKKGEVHALLGENGSGKSTLMKILMGIYSRDSGVINLFGKDINFANPAQALEHGIAMIHQELFPVMDMEIAENIFMGREIRSKLGFLVNIKKMRIEATKLLSSFGLDLNPKTLLQNLSVGQMQLIEIIKAISCNARIIIMDEPTSAITEKEANFLFEQIIRLKAENIAIIYISHRINEIFKISDRITILRDGNQMGTYETRDMDTGKLIKLMVGREMSEIYPKSESSPGDVILRVKNLSYGNKVRDVSFELRKGEILGLAGLIGSGRSELVESIFGFRKKKEGIIEIKNHPVNINHPKRGIKCNIALVTEDRKLTGLNLKGSLSDNITIVAIKKLTKFGLLNRKNESECADKFTKQLKIKSHGLKTPVNFLSGGNQQKVVISKWLASNPDIIIMDEPTRGIDVGAKQDIYRLMRELVAEGKAILMISSEMQEVIGMCDRIVVLSEGKKTGELLRPDFSQEAIMWYAAGEDLREPSFTMPVGDSR